MFKIYAFTLQFKVLFMSKEKHLDDLAQIRSIMERSKKYLSLSPWAAVMAGFYALTGASITFVLIPDLFNHFTNERVLTSGKLWVLFCLAMGMLILATWSALALNSRQARKNGGQLWTKAARRLALNFVLPMLAGGLFITALWLHSYYTLIPAAMLLFYGLSLINAGNFTFSNVRILGVLQTALGLGAAFWPNTGLWWWTMGFGWLHLCYGWWLYHQLKSVQFND